MSCQGLIDKELFRDIVLPSRSLPCARTCVRASWLNALKVHTARTLDTGAFMENLITSDSFYVTELLMFSTGYEETYCPPICHNHQQNQVPQNYYAIEQINSCLTLHIVEVIIANSLFYIASVHRDNLILGTKQNLQVEVSSCYRFVKTYYQYKRSYRQKSKMTKLIIILNTESFNKKKQLHA